MMVKLVLSSFFHFELDYVFEKYLYYEIQKTLKKIFSVFYQHKFAHPFEPNLEGSFYSPDLLVKSKNGSRSVLLDAKNKYSILSNSNNAKLENSDIFQMVYYSLCSNIDLVILVYPGDSSLSTNYPIPGSESKVSYLIKRDKAVGEL